MTDRSFFTDDEWAALTQAPLHVTMAVIAVAEHGPIALVKEASATAKALTRPGRPRARERAHHRHRPRGAGPRCPSRGEGRPRLLAGRGHRRGARGARSPRPRRSPSSRSRRRAEVRAWLIDLANSGGRRGEGHQREGTAPSSSASASRSARRRRPADRSAPSAREAGLEPRPHVGPLGAHDRVVRGVADAAVARAHVGATDALEVRADPLDRGADRALRASVLNVMRSAPQVSNACRNMRSFASVFTAVRCTDAASQVAPISAVNGVPVAPSGGPPTRRSALQSSRSRKRVLPTTRPSAVSVVTNGSAHPSRSSASTPST